MIGSETEARAFVEQRFDGAAIRRLDVLADELAVENTRQNLVAKPTLEEVWLRHIADSAQLLAHVPRGTGDWLDLGTGAGFPGLVVAALEPERPVHLVESRKRRVEWLERMRDRMELSNCCVHGKRLERVETFESAVISARAFAPLPKLVALSARFSTASTLWVLPKGRSASQEVQELPRRLRKMFHVEQSLTDAESGIVIGQGRVEAKS